MFETKKGDFHASDLCAYEYEHLSNQHHERDQLVPDVNALTGWRAHNDRLCLLLRRGNTMLGERHSFRDTLGMPTVAQGDKRPLRERFVQQCQSDAKKLFRYAGQGPWSEGTWKYDPLK